jgi:transposase
MGGLDTFGNLEVDPQRIRGRLSVGASKPVCESGQDAITGTRNCVAAPRRMNTRRNVFSSSQASFARRSKEHFVKENHRRCCGIDVHKNSVTVCVLPPVGQRQITPKKRKFRTYTRDLRQLRGWLKNCRVTEVAMESTGQYWRPLWNLLEGEFSKLILVNPQHIKGLNGYKTDPKDAHWIADLLESGKLKNSWVPPRPIRELRDLTRHRVNVLQDLNRAKNRIEQLCQTGNIKVTSAASDLFGVSGRKMLKALVEGKRDPGWMADYAQGRLRSKRRELELALEGTFTGEQRWLLAKELGQVEWLEGQIAVLEQEIERRVASFEEAIRRLTTIPGIERKTAWTIVAEIGADLSAFADPKHLASWTGLCPGNRESGGKRMSGRTRKSNRYVKRAMCQAAWAASHTKNTYLSAFYRRMRIRKGAPKAVMALAHHMIVVVHQVLSRQEEYIEFGADYYDQRNKPKTVARLVSRLQKLGYEVDLRAVPGAELIPDVIESLPEEEAASEQQALPTKRGRGRPCKCAERGIICRHRTSLKANPLREQVSSPV